MFFICFSLSLNLFSLIFLDHTLDHSSKCLAFSVLLSSFF
uniref:Uncharacterized protein n=1 Tax=Lepeophtheirus salmonis TaxID=72036 RepID=A0A0K2V045_LEPSM